MRKRKTEDIPEDSKVVVIAVGMNKDETKIEGEIAICPKEAVDFLMPYTQYCMGARAVCEQVKSVGNIIADILGVIRSQQEEGQSEEQEEEQNEEAEQQEGQGEEEETDNVMAEVISAMTRAGLPPTDIVFVHKK